MFSPLFSLAKDKDYREVLGIKARFRRKLPSNNPVEWTDTMDSVRFWTILGKYLALIMASSLIILLAGCGANFGSSPTPVSDSDLSGIAAVISLENNLVQQNGEVKLALSGFQPSEVVDIYAVGDGFNSTDPLARLVVDNAGSIDMQSVTLPEWVTSGTRSILATGEKSGKKAEETLYVHAPKLWMELANFSIKPTEKLGFIGGGFQPEEQVSVYFFSESQQRSKDPLLVITTDPSGNFPWTEISTPSSPSGQYTLVLAGSQTATEQSRGVILVPLSPEFTLEPYAGIPGTKLTFSGQGFLAGERLHIYLGGKENEISSFLADEYGNFWSAGTYGVPLDANEGVSNITVTGEQSGVSVSRPFTVLRLGPWLELSNYAGPSGSSINFSGGGFGAGEDITIHAEARENPPLAVGKTDQEGKFWGVGPTAVPPSQNDKVTFIVVGEESHTEAQASFQLLSRTTPSH